ncbi:MAG: class I SAM-dependent methyltransferase [Candidatus Woesearchaeota archaeon]
MNGSREIIKPEGFRYQLNPRIRQAQVLLEPPEWWEDDGGFFGKNYVLGDNSMEGFLPGTVETLEERTKRESDGIEQLLDIRGKNALILDVPCGYGRHSIELAMRKHKVIGVDINNYHLRKAKKNSKRIFTSRELAPHFKLEDMRDLKKDRGIWDNKFQCVINMFYSFGFFYDDKENISVMQNFYRVLKNDGKLLLHTDICKEMILKGKSYQLSEKRTLRNGRQLLIEEQYDPSTQRMNGSWTFLDPKEHATQLRPYSMRIYSAQEFQDMAREVGFSGVEMYGSFLGERFTPDSHELIVVAKK